MMKTSSGIKMWRDSPKSDAGLMKKMKVETFNTQARGTTVVFILLLLKVY